MMLAASTADELFTVATIAGAWRLSEKHTRHILKKANIQESTRSGSRGGPKRFSLGQVFASSTISQEKKLALLKMKPAQADGSTGSLRDVASSTKGVSAIGVSRANADRADSKTEIVLKFREFHAAANEGLQRALEIFAGAYQSGALDASISQSSRELFPRLSVPSLRRWVTKFQRGGPGALIPSYGNRRGNSIIERTPGMGDFILSMIAHQPHVRVSRIVEGLQVRFKGLHVPRKSAVRHWVALWKRRNPALFMHLRDPDDYKRKFSVAIGRADADIVRAGQLHEIDGTKLEVQCTDGLYHLNTIIDVFTRKMCAHLSPTASAQATAELLRKSLPMLGVPDEIKSDWGAEYLNQRIERAARRLGIHWHKVARPYAGELKPFIERNQGTILHMFFEQVPGFKGHSVRQAAEIRARHSFQQRRGERRNLVRLYDVSLSSSQLQSLLDRWLEHIYSNRPHAGLHGRTPNEVFRAAEARGEVKRVTEEGALDLLLAEDGVAQVGTKGIRAAGALFWCDDLIPWRGRTVQFVRTRDAGRLIVYSAEDAPQFIGIAINHDALGLDRQVAALAAKAREKDWLREARADLRRGRQQHRPENLLHEIIDDAEARAVAQVPVQTNIAAMPHRSAGLDAAAAALAALANDIPAPIAHPDRAEIDAAYEQITAARSTPVYDEAADAAAVLDRYRLLERTPREGWSPEDFEFCEMVSPLPEIQAYRRLRRVA